MTQFLAANLGFLHIPIEGLMKQSHKKQNFANPNEDIGFEWIISHFEDSNIIWHDGITGGFRSFIGFNPVIQKGIAVLSNSKEDWMNEISFQFLRKRD